MPNFSGVAQANAIAVPPINSMPNTQVGRVRVFYDSYTTIAAEDVTVADTITFGAERIPVGARITNASIQNDGVGGTSAIVSVAVGGVSPIVAADITAAGIDTITTIGLVTTSAGYPTMTFTTLTADMTDGKVIELQLEYVID